MALFSPHRVMLQAERAVRYVYKNSQLVHCLQCIDWKKKNEEEGSRCFCSVNEHCLETKGRLSGILLEYIINKGFFFFIFNLWKIWISKTGSIFCPANSHPRERIYWIISYSSGNTYFYPNRKLWSQCLVRAHNMKSEGCRERPSCPWLPQVPLHHTTWCTSATSQMLWRSRC